LTVVRDGDTLTMDFPALEYQRTSPPADLVAGLGVAPAEVYRSMDYLVVYEEEAQVLSIRPDQRLLRELDLRGVIVTAPGRECDFVSRFFAPKLSIPEDPITGSAHCVLTPYWAIRLGQKVLRACQYSRRLGERLSITLTCAHEGARVRFGGTAAPYLKGTIMIPG
jgi:predicted PhzF superfamily epimerase YddE/YHI9